MSYFIVQCPGCGTGGLGLGTQVCNLFFIDFLYLFIVNYRAIVWSIYVQPSKCCVPCGKLAQQSSPTGETEFARNKRLGPLKDMLKEDRKLAFIQKMENSSEIKKIDTIARFRTGVQMEERRMDLEKRSDRYWSNLFDIQNLRVWIFLIDDMAMWPPLSLSFN